MPENVIITHKNLGETPLECLERIRKERGIDTNISMTYAGRLDPMAEGLMIILVGEECKKKDQYLGLDKTYKFEILVGFETDTHDLLGLVENVASEISNSSGPRISSPESGRARPDHSESLFSSALTSAIFDFIGTFTQKYPNFSSKTVGGKQLFQLSKDDELPSYMPEHEVTIYNLKQTSSRTISKGELQTEILRRINLVHGDFRQEEIIQKWEEVFENTPQKSFEIISCTLSCSSGTYVRQLVADIGNKLSTPLVTYSINRTKVGEYGQNDTLNK